MVAYNGALMTCPDLPASLYASGRASGGAGASMVAWVGSGVAFKGSSGTLVAGMVRLWSTDCWTSLLQVETDLQPLGLQGSRGF